MRARKYADAQLARAIETSRNMREILVTLGLVPRGGNYETVRRRILVLGLPAPPSPVRHRGRALDDCTNAEIVDPSEPRDLWPRFSTNSLKRRLIAAGLKDPRCEVCHRETWNDRPIPLELDHVNGRREDNRLANLRILCPNCHAQTLTYRGKNIGLVATYSGGL